MNYSIEQAALLARQLEGNACDRIGVTLEREDMSPSKTTARLARSAPERTVLHELVALTGEDNLHGMRRYQT